MKMLALAQQIAAVASSDDPTVMTSGATIAHTGATLAPAAPAPPPTPGGGQLLGWIMQILKSLGLCASTLGLTGAGAARRMARGGPGERIAVKRTTRRVVPNPAAWDHIQTAFFTVGAVTPVADYEAVLVEAVA